MKWYGMYDRNYDAKCPTGKKIYIYIYIYYDKTNDGILMGMTMGRFRLWFISN
jgi:hypothetical protein